MSNIQNRMAEFGEHNNVSSIQGQGDVSRGNGNSSQHDVGSMDDYQFYASLDALLDGDNIGGEDAAAANSSQQYEGMAMTMTMATASQGLFSTHPAGGMNTTSANANSTSCSTGYAAQLASMQPYTVSDDAAVPSFPGLAPYAAPSSGVASYPQGMRLPMGMGMGMTQQPPQQAVVPLPTTSAAIQEPPPVAVAVAAAGKGKRGAPTSIETSRKRSREDHAEVSEDEEDNKGTRRAGRNLREQQRSQKITQQIDELRDLLASANIPFKADKYSTLVTVSDFIKKLQARSAMLDAEHKKLIETISKTNEIVSNKHVPASSKGDHSPGGMEINADSPDQALSSEESDELAFVRGIDYQTVFSSCGIPLAVASIDGRFMDCNSEFEKFTGYFREELLPHHNAGVVGPDTATSSSALPVEEVSVVRNKHSSTSRKNLSLFNLLSKEDMEGVFVAMSLMLKSPAANGAGKAVEDDVPAPGKDFWSGIVRLGRSPETNVSDLIVYCCIHVVLVAHEVFSNLVLFSKKSFFSL
jgi:PAS domain-containing protein